MIGNYDIDCFHVIRGDSSFRETPRATTYGLPKEHSLPTLAKNISQSEYSYHIINEQKYIHTINDINFNLALAPHKFSAQLSLDGKYPKYDAYGACLAHARG